MIKFVVFSLPRTGSSMLTERLSTHPDVTCFGAIFSATGWFKPAQPRGGGVLRRLRERMDHRWLDSALRIEDRDRLLTELFEANNDLAAVGFKHHLTGDKNVTQSLFASDLRKVFLTRTNHLATYSSSQVAKVTGQGAARRTRPVISGKCVFEGEDFDTYRKQRERLYQRAREGMTGTVLEIEYNEARTGAGMTRLAEFLDVDPRGIGVAPTLKRNSDSIIDRFENPDVVLDHLRKNGLEHLAFEAPALAAA
jgi:hypothetical protein